MTTVPTANSAASRPEAARRARRGMPGGAAPLLAAALAAAGVFPACDGEEWPDRDPVVIERAPVESLEFLPPGARYILEDSLTPVRVSGLRLGYACTRLITFDLERLEFVQPPGFAARVDLELPTDPSCAVLDSAVDTVIHRRFDASEGPEIILVDSLGAPLDTALLVRGTAVTDSLVHVPGSITNVTTRGRFTWYDTASVLPGTLIADSLSSCEFLSHADVSRRRDTATVRYILVTRDAASAPDSCRGAPRTDTLARVPTR